MGRRKNKNKEVELFDFEIEQQQVKDNIGVSHITPLEEDKCKSNENLNLDLKTPHHNPIHTNTGLKFNKNTNSIIDKQDSVFLFVHKYFATINSYTEIDDLEIILDKEIIDVDDDGFNY